MKRLSLILLMVGFATQAVPVSAETSAFSFIIDKAKAFNALSDRTKTIVILGGFALGSAAVGMYVINNALQDLNRRVDSINFSRRLGNIQPRSNISQEEFETNKNHLSKPLQEFLKDFQTWSQAEKNTIQISVPVPHDSSGITITGLNRKRHDAYEGDLASWLNKRVYEMAPKRGQISPTIIYRVNLSYLKTCIEYLQQ